MRRKMRGSCIGPYLGLSRQPLSLLLLAPRLIERFDAMNSDFAMKSPSIFRRPSEPCPRQCLVNSTDLGSCEFLGFTSWLLGL